jgi:endonuclease/exonuclease/phosphatase family metal-dependent hydrolase
VRTVKGFACLGLVPLGLVCAGWACGLPAGSADGRPPVAIDGVLDEWRGLTPVIEDPLDAAPGAAVDLRAIRMRDDGQWLYVAVDWTRAVNAQSMRGTVSLAFDADGDAATGADIHGLTGVDVIIELSQREGVRSGDHGAGTGIRPVLADGRQPLASAYLADVLVAPTVASSEIEIRVRRGARLPGSPPLFAGARTRVTAFYETEAGTADRTDAATYEFQQMRTPRPVPAADSSTVTKPAGATRVLVWNVSERGMIDHADAFRRVVSAMNPDVLLLDEVYEHATAVDLAALLNQPPLARDTPWKVVLGRGGGRQKTLVATTLPMRFAPELEYVTYEPGSLERLAERFPAFSTQLTREAGHGLAATGAWVAIAGRDVLFVPFDLQSSGYAGSVEDELRILQARLLSERVAGMLPAGDGVPVVIGGDVNAVGSRMPIDQLQQATAPADRPLAILDLRHVVDRVTYTWREPNSPFVPGRLDYVFHGGTGLTPAGGFPFEPEEFAAAALAAMGIERQDAGLVSDHLPVIADFRVAPGRR